MDLNQLDSLLWIKSVYDFPQAMLKRENNTSFYAPWINWLQSSAQKAQDMWLAELGNQLRQTANSLAWRDKYVWRVADIYAWFGNVLWQSLDDRNQAYDDNYRQLLWQYTDQFNTFNSQYWPQWSMTQRLNDYYSTLWNQLINKQANNRLVEAWLGSRYWLSWNAVRLNQANSDANALAEQQKLFGEQYQQLDWLNKTYNQLLDNSLKTKANLSSDYLKNVEDAKLNLKNQLSQWLIQLLLNNEQMKQNKALAWGWGTATVKPTVQNKIIQDLTNKIAQDLRWKAPVYTTNPATPWASKTPTRINSNWKQVIWYLMQQ